MTLDFSNMSAEQILEKIIADKKVDPDEVEALGKKLNEDWVVDQQEVELLFRVNQSIGDNDEQCTAWTQFFVQNVTRLVVMDLESPGQIDASEGDWLAEIVEKYQCSNLTEKALFDDIKKTTTKIEGKLSDLI